PISRRSVMEASRRASLNRWSAGRTKRKLKSKCRGPNTRIHDKQMLLERHRPDIAELHRVPVVLEHEGPGLADIAAAGGGGGILGELRIVVDFDAIPDHRHHWALDHFAVLAFGGMKLDVVALPNRGRLGDVLLGRFDAI